MTGIDKLLPGLISDLGFKTDEEWLAHDRKIEDARARLRKQEQEATLSSRRATLLAQGCPNLPLDRATADDFDSRASGVAQLARFDSEPNKSIAILAGNAGTGKTVAALEWLFRTGGTSPFFITATQFETRGRYDRDKSQAWRGASAMVLDDLGSEYADRKGHYLSELDSLFDWYAGGRGRLVVTTNGQPRQFEKRYGARIWSRLHETARWYPVVGDDRRVQT